MAFIKSEQSAVQRVASHVREMIRRQRIAVGGVLPNYHQLCVDLDVSYMTVKVGMDVLAAEGLIRRVPSKGTFVAKRLVQEPQTLEQIGLIYPSSRGLLYTSGYLLEIMRGITAAAPAGSDLHIFSIHEEGLTDAAHMGEWTVGGALLLGVENDDYLRRFATWNIPGVVVDYLPRDVPLDAVACDNEAAVRRLVAHLAGLGHRRVAYVAAQVRSVVRGPRNDGRDILLTKESSDARERLEWSERVLHASGLAAEVFCQPETSPEMPAFYERLLGGWHARSGRPTAILADSDMAALQLLHECQRRGLRVPADLSIAAVGGSGEFARREQAGITCCHFDFVGMGRTAMERLIARCGGAAAEAPRAHRIGFEFAVGTTVGPVGHDKGGRHEES